MLFGHNVNDPVGVWKDFSVDERGLFAKGQIFTEMSRGNDIRTLLQKGVVKGLSIGARVKDFDKMESGGLLFKELDLRELSIVLFPANPQAEVSTVKDENGDIVAKQVLSVLRNAGMSKSQAEAFYAQGKNGIAALRNEEAIAKELLTAFHNFKTEVK